MKPILSLFFVPVISLAFVFPEDHFQHFGYGVEWWNQTGVLNDGALSYEFTLFRKRLSGIDVYLVHVMAHDHREDERLFFELPVGYVEVTDQTIVHDGPYFGFTMGFHGDFWRLTFYSERLDLDLMLFPKKAPVPHMDGIVPMVKGESFYYSVTNLDVFGTVRVNDGKIEVSGKSWFDHQWGDFEVVPWNWFSVRLENGAEIMLFEFPERGVKFGTVVWKDGRYEHVEEFEIDFESSYENVPIPPAAISIPLLKIELDVNPVSRNQFNEAEYTPPYWEGLCRVMGTVEGMEVEGWAFFEGWR